MFSFVNVQLDKDIFTNNIYIHFSHIINISYIFLYNSCINLKNRLINYIF